MSFPSTHGTKEALNYATAPDRYSIPHLQNFDRQPHLRGTPGSSPPAGFLPSGGPWPPSPPQQMCPGCNLTQLPWFPCRQPGHPPYGRQVQAIRDLPLPLTQRKLREFLGLVNRFVPSCAQTLQPLHDLLKTAPKGAAPLTWTEASTAVFQSIKDALANATLLVHPQPQAPPASSLTPPPSLV